MTNKEIYMAQFRALIDKLKDADDWSAHLPEAIAFFSKHKPFVVLESPFAADTEESVQRNVDYARAACHDALVNHGEIPFASHIKYTQPGILDDTIPWERALGISAGLAEGLLATRTVLYVDRGVSSGMLKGIEAALKAGRTVVLRSLPGWQGSSDDLSSQTRLAIVQHKIAQQLGISPAQLVLEF